jgi:ribosomal protein L7/L12
MFGWFRRNADATPESEAARLNNQGSAETHVPTYAEGQNPDAVELSDRVRMLVASGQLIAAIKAHREETGADLRTAKTAIDQYMSR